MSAPTQIKYRGQIYKRAATQHKKCPTGQHWNEPQHKCVELPAEVAQASDAAHRASYNANSLQKPRLLDTKSTVRRLSAAKQLSHTTAAGMHQQARDLARRHGFAELSQQHELLMRHHENRRNAYQG
jgi:hypothetical protein